LKIRPGWESADVSVGLLIHKWRNWTWNVAERGKKQKI